MASSARIEELERKFSENPRRYFAPLANEYRKAGDLTQAISICRTYVPQQPGHMSGQIVFGQALFEAGEFDESRTVFESALQLDPENLIALRQLGDIARERGEITSARAWYRRVLDADPRNDEIAALVTSLDGIAEAPVRTEPVRGVDGAPPDGLNGWHDINPERTLELPQTVAETAQRLSGATHWSAVVETPAPDGAATSPVPSTDVGEAATPVASGPLPAASSPHASLEASSLEARVSDAVAPPEPEERSITAPVAGPPIGHEPTFGAAEVVPPVADAPPPAASAPFDGFYSDAMTATESVSASSPVDPSGFGLEVMEFVPPPRAQRVPDAAAATAGTDRPSAFVTETMAELYLQQGFHAEALEVYRQLLAHHPGDDALRDRVAQLERGARSSVGSAADVSDSVIEAASVRRQTPRTRSVRAFFGDLAARRVVVRDADRAPESGPDVSEAEAMRSAAAAHDRGPAPEAGTTEQPPLQTDAEVGVSVPVAHEGVARSSGESWFAASTSVEAPVSSEPLSTPLSEALSAATHDERMHADATGADVAGPDTVGVETPHADVPTAAVAHAGGESAEGMSPEGPSVEGPSVEGPSVEGPFALGSSAEARGADVSMAAGGIAAATGNMDGASASGGVGSDPAATASAGGAGAFFEADPYAAGFDVSEMGGGAPGGASLAEPEFGGDGLVSRRRDEVDEFGLPMSGDAESFAFDAGDSAPLASAPTPDTAAPPARTPQQTGSVDVLFSDAAVVSGDEAAASTLSAAFGGPSTTPEVQGAPVRRASTELSLDSVFRETSPASDAPPRRDASAFSFDQFFGYDPFAEPDAAGGASAASPPSDGGASSGGAGGAGGAGDAAGPGSAPGGAETEQFSSWLSGLKKK